MSIPVYLFTGFLDAGKTAFIQETLEDPGFNTGEKTLVLLCEEGENEYRPERFAGGNVSFLPVEEQAGLTTAFLKDYQKKHRVDRVLIEYNGMWPLQALYDALPTDWDIYQIILLADSTTFASYMTNMRQLAVDKLQDPEMVIFNRCTEETTKSPYRRTVLAMNNTARIFFENTDGSMDDGVSDEDLPYDVKADPIHVLDEQFGVWYLDALEHPERYSGKNVKVKGQVFRMEDLPDNVYVLGRYAMTCCANDIGGIGFACFVDGPLPTEGEWVEVIAHMQEDMSPLHHRETIVLVQQKIKSAKKPEEEVVNFTN